ncbi:MAG: 2-oxoacid:acceptor oxidoreductase family protein [Desulfotalea sp.]
MNPIKKLCTSDAGEPTVLQGNIAFAVGCVRSGIHAVDGYPGTPSTEVIDKGLTHVQDMINVAWSVSEATAVSMGHGHSLAGNDCVVTMKIPGLFQAGDPFTSSAFFNEDRGALVYYLASDFTPSSTQHLVDPRPLIKSCFVPILEPRNHQELHEAAELAADLAREHNTPVVILASGTLCHSEGLVRLSETKTREKVEIKVPLKAFSTLPVIARKCYDRVLTERLPALMEMVENSPMNKWHKGAGKVGVITYGVNDIMVQEMRQSLGEEIDILSLGFTYPLPTKMIKEFHKAIDGPVYIVEDGYKYIQEEVERLGLKIIGKKDGDLRTEWTPASIAKLMGYSLEATSNVPAIQPLIRPPMVCAGCPYRLFGETVRSMKKKGQIEACFGDIGCNTLLYFMDAVDTGLCMGASECNRAGYVSALPEKASKVISLIGDGTECHSGLDSTRNTIFRHIAGVKVILDNNWTAMTGGQPGPTSPVNLAGQKNTFDLQASLVAHGAKVVSVSGYDRKAIRKALLEALADAEKGVFTTMVVTGVCIRKMPKESFGNRYEIDEEICKRCGLCQICPGIENDADKLPSYTNFCSGCAGEASSCAQMCPVGAIKKITDKKKAATKVELPVAPDDIQLAPLSELELPEKLAVAIRGVGGQGNLFFGRVLTQLAFLAGYGETNVVKGETHGMAQMGGPVISTFTCGKVYSPVPLPGTADCLVTMEQSEVLRPGFVELLKPGGTVLLAKTKILPYGQKEDAYPDIAELKKSLEGYNVIEVDVLATAIELGDDTGRCANVVMMGALSSLAPFTDFPDEFWLQALKSVSPKPAIWTANHAAFKAGQTLLA